MKSKVVASLFVFAMASSASAQVVCSDLSECRSLRDRVNARIAELEGCVPPTPTTRIAHGANEQETTFTRDTSIAALGEAWRDPSGMIWGDIVRNEDHSIRYEDHSIRYMDQFQATTYCESKGATLPSREDFVRLRGYMGATTAASEYSGAGFTPQVLPNLYRTENGRSVSNYFWSSSVHPDSANDADYFDGRTGVIDNVYRDVAGYSAVRCAARR